MFFKDQKTVGRARLRVARIHSIPAWITGRNFVGEFESGPTKYKLEFAPKRGEISGDKFHITGTLTISGPTRKSATMSDFRMVLASSQGGIGEAPPHHHSHQMHGVAALGLDARAYTYKVTFRAPEDSETMSTSDHDLPGTDSTGEKSFCGVMYFKMDPINSRAMGVSADLSKAQLNLRFAPDNPEESEYQDIYSDIVAAVLGDQFNKKAADEAVSDLNELLGQTPPVA